ncbi:MAG TPA: hypothetical protein V6C57_21690 [Coleofasciculaceae cyanobacterium]
MFDPNFLQNLVNKLITPPFPPLPDEFGQEMPLPKGSKQRRQPAGSSRKSGSRKSEVWYRDRLATALRGQTEVSTPSGRIDIVTGSEIIEVKAAALWKHALGQIMVYSHHYPYHRKRIHLFGAIDPAVLFQATEQCRNHGVIVTWEQ